MNERFIRWTESLSIKQAKIISFCLAVFIVLIFTTCLVAGIDYENYSIAKLIIIAFMFVIFMVTLAIAYYWLLCAALGTYKKEAKQEFTKTFDLPYDQYVEIFRREDGYHKGIYSAKMDFQIVQKFECRYFAQMVSENVCHLMVMDQNNEIIYETDVDKFLFMVNTFTR